MLTKMSPHFQNLLCKCIIQNQSAASLKTQCKMRLVEKKYKVKLGSAQSTVTVGNNSECYFEPGRMKKQRNWRNYIMRNDEFEILT